MLPVDSEHSAIFQSLPAHWAGDLDAAGVRRLILTASGGPFRERAADTFASITPDDACKHPNWVMGRKISVDSASLMSRAVDGLSLQPQMVLIDGNRVPKQITLPAQAIVKGDATVAEISAASILAKTARDAELVALDAIYPEYGFARHKGYPTAEHLAAIEQHGVLPIHRKTFGPVKRWLIQHQDELF